MSRGRLELPRSGAPKMSVNDIRRPDRRTPQGPKSKPAAGHIKVKILNKLWTPTTLKQNSSKQLLDTKISVATQHHEAKAPSRDKKERRRSDTKSTRKSCRIIGFPLVSHTSTISMLFCKQRILNATGATRTFCKNRKNREDKYRSFLWSRATFR